MRKKKYIFRSSNMALYTLDELVKKMASYNTTITEADTIAVLNVMKQIVLDHIKLGFSVQTPLGLFFATAGGSTEDVKTEFDPTDKDLNHDIRLKFRPARDVEKDVLENTQIERVANTLKTIVNIDTIRNACGNDASPIHPGDMILIFGNFIKFDPDQEDQGVFLSDGTNMIRLSYYTKVTEGTIEARIEPSMKAGTYTVSIHNMPLTTFLTTEYKNPFVITA